MALGSLWWTGSQLSRTLAGAGSDRCPDGALGSAAGRTAASRGSLGYPVPAPYRRQPRGTMLDRAHARAADPAAWRDLLICCCSCPWAPSVRRGRRIVRGRRGDCDAARLAVRRVSGWRPLWREVRIDTLPEALIVVVALPVSTLAAYLLIAGVSRAHAAWAARCWDQARARGSPSGPRAPPRAARGRWRRRSRRGAG